MDAKQLVIGIDLGTCDSYVAFVSKGAVDVVQNEVSQRKTPSLVGFTSTERLLGDAALSQIKSNTKNTCRNFKHLVGQKLDSANVQAETFWSTCELQQADDGFVGCHVTHKGEPVTYSATAITAMFLTKLKDITEAWCQGTVADAVIGVPSYFSDFQRAALLDAAKIAGLNVLRVMNEHTATALEYGYMRTNSFDPDKPTTVAFCQMGHAVFSVAVVQFFRGKLSVLCEKSDKVGGRDMDECLIRSFAAQFQKKTGCDVLSNKKAMFKLEDAVTKTKKILSANSESGLSCECLMDDHDFSSHIDRSDFLEMCKPMMQKVSDVLEAAKAASGLPPSAIDSVEMCGGASRVPWVKEMCSKAFGGKELSTTMNADECVARGCAVQAAILSPLFKAREFKVEDTSPFPVQLGWSFTPSAPSAEAPAAVERSALVFPGHSMMNLLKVVTFFRKDSFQLKAAYADDKVLQPGTQKDLGTYTIELPAQAEPKKVKVRAALTLHGTFRIEGAQLVEELEEPPAAEPTPGDGDVPMPDIPPATPATPASPADEPAPPQNGTDATTNGRKRPEGQPDGRRRKCKRTDLVVKQEGTPGLSPSDLQKCTEEEQRMISEMREVTETNARRNDLEAYILTMRSSITEGQKYGDYIEEADRTTLQGQLERAEDWLYDHADSAKEVFVEKLAELKVLGGPVENRFREEGRRPEVIAGLEEAVAGCKTAASSSDPKVQAAGPARLREVEQAAEEASRWLEELKGKQAQLPKHQNPVLLCAEVEAKTEALQRLADALLDGRAEPAAEPTAAAAESEDPPREAAQADQAGQAGQAHSGMDVD